MTHFVGSGVDPFGPLNSSLQVRTQLWPGSGAADTRPLAWRSQPLSRHPKINRDANSPCFTRFFPEPLHHISYVSRTSKLGADHGAKLTLDGPTIHALAAR